METIAETDWQIGEPLTYRDMQSYRMDDAIRDAKGRLFRAFLIPRYLIDQHKEIDMAYVAPAIPTTRKKLFDYAVLWHPTAEEAADGDETVFAIEPGSILAFDENEVKFLATRELTDEYGQNPEQLEFLIRPW